MSRSLSVELEDVLRHLASCDASVEEILETTFTVLKSKNYTDFEKQELLFDLPILTGYVNNR